MEKKNVGKKDDGGRSRGKMRETTLERSKTLTLNLCRTSNAEICEATRNDAARHIMMTLMVTIMIDGVNSLQGFVPPALTQTATNSGYTCPFITETNTHKI